jgi:4-amino-4-deoxy-L-arabinose transferase-like glycosyltransferase
MPLNERRWLVIILTVALLLRLAFALSQDHAVVYGITGGDSGWYLRSGYQLLTDTLPGPVPTAPLYLLFLGAAQALFSPEVAVVVIRIAQVLMGTATCYFAYRLACILSQDERAGLLAAGVLAISPVFIIEPALIQTETPYIFLVMGALLVYLSQIQRHSASPENAGSVGANRRFAPTPTNWLPTIVLLALLLGLATMTRAVLLLFPLGLAAHMLMVWGWRAGLKRAAVLLVVYTLLVSIWTVHNALRWNRLVIGAEGYTSFIYVGAVGWQDPYVFDEQLMQEVPELAEAERLTEDVRNNAYTQAAADAIGRDPAGWIRRRINELASAYLQPHGTAFFPGESLKQLAGDWLQHDRSLGGLLDLTRGDAFWPKLSIYLFHYVGLLFGLVGMWRYRRQWRMALPLVGYVLYTTLVHLPLLAIPRYIFVTEVVWWVFAAVTLVALADRASASRRRQSPVMGAHSTVRG